MLDAAEALGLEPDGRLFALNSYENRVYRVGRIDADPVVMKFYRAGALVGSRRFSRSTLLRCELAAQEIAGRARRCRCAGATLHHHRRLSRWRCFRCAPGRRPELDQAGARELLGRTLARIHAVGARRRFRACARRWSAQCWASARARRLLRSPLLPEHMRAALRAGRAPRCCAEIEAAFARAAPLDLIRLHGDCHLGNILWQARGPLFVDLDDCLNGPRIQDLWMFLSGSRRRAARASGSEIMEGYEQFGALEFRELRLVEPLRALRMLNHAAWVAERWADPAFPRAFPWAGEARFWEGYVGDLRAQCEVLEEPPRCW